MKNLIFVLACLFSVSVFGQGACNNQSSVTHQGYEYDIVEIGDQCWFAENCRYLPVVYPSNEGTETDPYYYVYGYEGTDVEAAQTTDNYETYGVLYNLPAVMTEGICPSGWHIPSDDEWQTMEMSLGMSEAEVRYTDDGLFLANHKEFRGTDEGNQMKSTSGWNDVDGIGNGNGSNSSGFNALPGGYRLVKRHDISYSGGFSQNGYRSAWWSASESGSYCCNAHQTMSLAERPPAWNRSLSYDMKIVYRITSNSNNGYYARCVQD